MIKLYGEDLPMFEAKELQQWLQNVSEHLEKPVTIYMIGGGSMAFQKLKEATKDIDLIVRSKEEFKLLDLAIRNAGFEHATDLDDFYLTALAVYLKEDSRIDVFVEKVGRMLFLTNAMVGRAAHFGDYGNISVNLVSKEDVFLFKCMTTREGDLKDCTTLLLSGLDYNVIYDEVLRQSKKEQKWFFWVFERVCALEDFNGRTTSLKGKLFSLVKEHWSDRPEDFMADVKNIERHIPDAKLRNTFL